MELFLFFMKIAGAFAAGVIASIVNFAIWKSKKDVAIIIGSVGFFAGLCGGALIAAPYTFFSAVINIITDKEQKKDSAPSSNG